MKQVNNLEELKDVLTEDDFGCNDIEIRFRKTKTTFYYAINNIYAIYHNDKIIGLYDADNNVLKYDKNYMQLRTIWQNVLECKTHTIYINVDIDKYIEENGLICGVEDLFSIDHA